MKSLEALLRGYLLFRCDGKRYLTYARAKAVMPETGPASFDGWHVVNGWRCFYQRLECLPAVQPTIVADGWHDPEKEWTTPPKQGWSASADL